ncbi:MAG: homoserine dehydrogenase [Deltaproteobacteria bacterium]|nr:homoserine dehydrogenase [Deltaproteobacteria bacterium]MBW2308395.1 homoserine dehydrogenase [Deltaproteobacteria bacterium]
MVKIPIIICGFGNVGRAFGSLLAQKALLLKEQYDLEVNVRAVVDIRGAAVAGDAPIPMEKLVEFCSNGGQVQDFAILGRPGLTSEQVADMVPASVWVEITPTNINHGEPGLGNIRTALYHGLHVITANKGPLVLRFKELMEIANARNVRIFYSAATAAALPTLDVGIVCLAGTHLISAEGILNGTSNYILTRMQEDDVPYAEALSEAQKLGIAEPDPSYDVEGWDTANKLVLIANGLFGAGVSLNDVTVQGIREITPVDIQKARENGKVIRLIGKIQRDEEQVIVRVAPLALDRNHPMASVSGSEKGITYSTDIMDRVTVTGGKSSPLGAAAAMMKDLINLAAQRRECS